MAAVKAFSFTFLLFVLFLHQPAKAQWKTHEINKNTHMRAVHATSTTTCWIGGSGGAILKTLDGGINWQTLQIPSADSLDFRDIHAFDNMVAIAMSAGLSEEGKARIYRTDNGGKNWNLVYETTQNGVFLNGISFWDQKRGICMGDPVDGKFFILTTEDAGKTWQELNQSKRPTALPNEAAYAASGTSLMTFGKGQVYIGTGGTQFARVLRSSDYGNTWEATTTSLPANATTGIFGLRFWSSTEGIAVGGDYKNTSSTGSNVLLTQDGGKSWTIGATTNPVGLKESAVIFNKKLLTVGPNGSSYSTDEGKTWEHLGNEAFHAISVAGKTAYAVGANGLIGTIQQIPSVKN